MPEMKNNFQKGRMNKDLDERMVPSGEYRDALNVEVTTSEGSDVGTLQTLKGNEAFSFIDPDGSNEQKCIGSIVDHKNDKIYWMISGKDSDLIVEYDYISENVEPVCVDRFAANGVNALNFEHAWLITGINIIDGILFWTDNNSEPKRINIERAKQGSNGFSTHTNFLVRDVGPNAAPNSWPISVGDIKEEHLTVIKKGPPTAPVLEMIDTLRLDADGDGDGNTGGGELEAPVTIDGGTFLDSDTGEFISIPINITVPSTMDYVSGDIIIIYQLSIPTNAIRAEITSITIVPGNPGETLITINILSGIKDTEGEGDLFVKLEQKQSLFSFKFPRFAYRYKFEDGEYSQFSPFSQPAFLPGKFNYLPKEGYNLGMVNRVRRLAIKDFVHTRSLPDDVISIDILYKESNSSNIYSVKTIKKRDYNPTKWDEWNGISVNAVGDTGIVIEGGHAGLTKGFMPITTEMIHAVLPANQLLRPWDNVPRKALAQELVGNRLVYGNYLQNYNLTNSSTGDNNIKVDIKVQLRSNSIGDTSPQEVEAGPNMLPRTYSPSKSVKSLRTYQIGVVYLDEYGRETPVFSEDKRGEVTSTGTGMTSQASIYVDKDNADRRNCLLATMQNNPPDWATHVKFFVKETSNEYYNLAMDRWYDAEDGNVWLSFPSAERNKVDEETFLILKKQHDQDTFVTDPARYKIIAIENEAPRFIKLQNISMGGITDGPSTPLTTGAVSVPILGLGTDGFPLEGQFYIKVEKQAFDDAGWKETLVNQDISQVFFRVKSVQGISLSYRLKQVSYDNQGAGFYKLESGKIFGGDMSHTSTDGTYAGRDQQCQVQITKRIPEDKAEFEGRFFVKILKDGDLLKNLNIIPEAGLSYVQTSSMIVQYINPRAVMVNGPGGWDGFGTNYKKISIDGRQGMAAASPGNGGTSGQGGMDGGHGRRFWEMAGKVSGSESNSSGWFIDAVEGFRPYNGKVRPLVPDGKNAGWRQDPQNTALLNLCWTFVQGLDGDFNAGPGGTDDWKWANARGLNNYNETLGYLQTSGTGVGSQILNSPGNTMQDAPTTSGGQVAKTLLPNSDIANQRNAGIDPESGMIQLSYSGINIGGSTSCIGPSSWTGLVTHHFQDSTKHATDIAFITKLTQPGTLWRWKEDPGKVIYKTKPTTGLTNSSTPYTTKQFAREQLDFDGSKGVFLWNYVTFADYPIKPNHLVKYKYTCIGNWIFDSQKKTDWISRSIKDHESSCSGVALCGCSAAWLTWSLANFLLCSVPQHLGHSGSNNFGGYSYPEHNHFPAGAQDWDREQNKRRRFVFSAEPILEGPTQEVVTPGTKLGGVAPHYYLPTNNCNLPGHFDTTANPITQHPNIAGASGNFEAAGLVAPGIRPDGMYMFHEDPGGGYPWDDGTGIATLEDIPQYKRWDASQTTFGDPTTGTALEKTVPGSVTWEIIEAFTPDEDNFSSTNPAIWETEPKEDVGLDIYHEVGQIYPIYLNDNTIEQHVGSVSEDITKNSFAQCWDGAPPTGNNGGTIVLSTGTNQDIRIVAAKDDKVMLADTDGVYLDDNNSTHTTPTQGAYLMFWRADGSVTEGHVGSVTNTPLGTWYQLVGKSGEVGVHNMMVQLPWFNCYSFGNGVESDRVRDDYNQVTIDNGPKASTTLEQPYIEDRKKNGFIWSGIYNSTSGVNNLNQFIQAEAITKDINPTYGSIQKMFVRDSDLVAYCEDRVLKILANKDALYNADGNTNVVATNKVLGSAKPFVGDYGISKNPESFASDSYRSYFADTSRGAVLRLSMDGITPISNVGMKDWFADIMPMYANKTGSSIFGSFDDKKEEYNITFKDNPYDKEGIIIPPPLVQPTGPVGPTGPTGPTGPPEPPAGQRLSGYGGTQAYPGPISATTPGPSAAVTNLRAMSTPIAMPVASALRVFPDKPVPETTLSFSEPSKSWVSFKSWIQEGGVSLNNSYYTFSSGELWKHHVNEVRNNFYNTQFDSSVDLIFNQAPSIIKSFKTLNYEGSQSRVTLDIINNPDYYDNFAKSGWYVDSMISNAQEIGQLEFWDKEDKWFSQIQGTATKWLNDGTAGNIDPREFSYQGIGNAGGGCFCDNCAPGMVRWECGDVGGSWCGAIMGSDASFSIPGGLTGNINYEVAPWFFQPGNHDLTFGDYAFEICNSDYPNNPCHIVIFNDFNGTSGSYTTANQVITAHNTIYQGYDPPYSTQNPMYPQNGPMPGMSALWLGASDIEMCFDPMLPSGSVGCVKVFDKPGFLNEQECIDSGCGEPEKTWECMIDGCVERSDGSGAFSSLCECSDNCCGDSENRFFDCQNLQRPNFLIEGCMDDGITQDPWIVANRPNGWVGPASNFNNDANHDGCNCEYSSAASTWDCLGYFVAGVTDQNGCVEVFDGSGQFVSQASCGLNCSAPCPSWTATENSIPATSGGAGACINGNSYNNGVIEVFVQVPSTNYPSGLNWKVTLFLMDPAYQWAYLYDQTPGNANPFGNTTFSNLQPGTYKYTITDLDSGCSFDYTTQVGCNDPIPETFNCHNDNNQIVCTDPGDGSGYYNQVGGYMLCMNDPLSPCIPIISPQQSWDCEYNMNDHTYSCVDPLDGSGTYATQIACEFDPLSPCELDPDINWLCHALACSPTILAVNNNAGIYSTYSQCMAGCQ